MAIPLPLSQVPAATPYAQYIATGGQTVFPYPFPITQDQDLVVVVNGVTQSTDVGYTLSGQGNITGGNVTFTLGLTAGDIVTVYRDIVIERLTQIGQNSGYSSVTFNAEFNNIYLILQQLSEKLAYTLQIPYSNNPAPVTTLQPGIYANSWLSFDAYGNPQAAVLTNLGAISFAILAPFLGLVPTQAEVDKGVTASITDFLKDPGDIRRYGGDKAALDNTAALAAAVAQASSTATDAAQVYAPPGNWNFASTTGAVCTLPDGVAVRGAGRDVTTFTVTGSANTTGFFRGTNVLGFSLSDITLVGNSVASGFNDGGAVFMSITNAATGPVGNYQIDRCRFSNFQATYWICQTALSASAQTHGSKNFAVRNCDFVSFAGNARSTAIGVPSFCIMSVGGSTPASTFENIEVCGNTADCTYLKGFFLDFGGSKHVNIHDNVVVGAGTDAFFSDDSGCYAFASYATGYFSVTNISAAASAVVSAAGHTFTNGDTVTFSQMYDAGFATGNPGSLMRALNDLTFTISGVVAGVSFVVPVNTSALDAYSSGGVVQNVSWPEMTRYHHNTVDGVRDCGFYFASNAHIEATDNEVTGQTCNVETSLRKGAIVAVGCRDAFIIDNKIWGCQQGIHAEPLMNSGSLKISGNRLQNCLTGCDYIRVTGCFPNVASSVSESVHITDNVILGRIVTDLTHVAIRIDSTNLYGIRRLKISNNTLDVIGGAFVVNVAGGSGDAILYDVDISGNKIVAQGGHAVWLLGGTPYYSIRSNSFVKGTYFVDTDHLFGSGVRASVVANDFQGGAFTTGAWVRIAAPAAGSQFRANTFENVAPANMVSNTDAVNLGVDAPNWVGKQGNIVETPRQVEQGVALSKYINTGYFYDATAVAWQEMRVLTGN